MVRRAEVCIIDKTESNRKRWNLISKVYGRVDRGMQTGKFKMWREQLMGFVEGPRVLEVGVGAGANLPLYPKDIALTAIDFSPGMLERARQRASLLNLELDLRLMDVQRLEFPDNTFDTVISTCVFCSVPDPAKGLREIRRVLKPRGQLFMLEHVGSQRRVLKHIMNLANHLVAPWSGEHINRQTGATLREVGFDVEEEDLWLDILKFFRARQPVARETVQENYLGNDLR